MPIEDGTNPTNQPNQDGEGVDFSKFFEQNRPSTPPPMTKPKPSYSSLAKKYGVVAFCVLSAVALLYGIYRFAIPAEPAADQQAPPPGYHWSTDPHEPPKIIQD